MSSSAILLHLLPPELLLLTADHLSTRDLSVLSRVCHHLHSSLTSPLAKRFAAEPTAILIWAVSRKNMTIVKRALAEGADPDGDDYECPLAIAVGKVFSVEIASVLLEAGANVDERERTFPHSGEHMGAEHDDLAELLHMFSEEIGNQYLDDDSGSEESETNYEDDSSPKDFCCTGHC